MRLWLDTEPLIHWPSGISAYVIGLLHGLAELRVPDLEVHTSYATLRLRRLRQLRRRLAATPGSTTFHTVPLPGRLAARLGPLRRVASWPPLPAFDVAHSTSMVLSRLAPARRQVLTVYDVGFLRYPERRFGGDTGAAVAARFQADVQRADAILAISEFTRRELTAVCGVPPARIFVTPLASQCPCEMPAEPGEPDEAVLARHGLAPQRYVLSVGLLSPRKNYETVLAAFRGFRERQPEAILVIVGNRGWDTQGLESEIAALGPAGRWIRRASQAELAALYRQAVALVCLSWYEGFGIPVLEAMGWGCPAIVAAGSALGEVLGDTGLVVAPDAAAAATQAMDDLWSHPERRAECAARGRRRAAGFTWRRTAETTLEAYRQVPHEDQ